MFSFLLGFLIANILKQLTHAYMDLLYDDLSVRIQELTIALPLGSIANSGNNKLRVPYQIHFKLIDLPLLSLNQLYPIKSTIISMWILFENESKADQENSKIIRISQNQQSSPNRSDTGPDRDLRRFANRDKQPNTPEHGQS